MEKDERNGELAMGRNVGQREVKEENDDVFNEERVERRAVASSRGRRLVERLLSSRLAARFLDGFFWLTLASLAARIGTLISLVCVANILGAVVYGEFCLIRTTVNGFVVLASFGMGRTAIKYVAELTATDKARVGRVIALNYVFSLISSVLVAVLFCLATPRLYAGIPDAERLIPYARLSSILLILSAFVSVQAGVMSGFKAFRGLAIASAASGLGSIPFFLLGAYWGGLSGAIVGFATGALLNCLINSCFVYFQLKKHGIRYRFDEFWQERKILWNFCLPQTLTSVTTGMIGMITTIWLARQDNGITEVAIFETARQIQTSILFLPNIATQTLLPTLTEFNALKDKEMYLKTLKCNACVNLALATFVGIAVGAAAPWIMRAMGEGFETGAATLIVLLGVGVILSVCNVCASALTSLGAVWSGFFLNVIYGCVFLTAAWQTLNRGGGATGLAGASLGAQFFYLLLCLGVIKRLIALKNDDGRKS